MEAPPEELPVLSFLMHFLVFVAQDSGWPGIWDWEKISLSRTPLHVLQGKRLMGMDISPRGPIDDNGS